MITWGMVGNSHDASMACFLDERPVWACMAKDFDHVKDKDNSPDFHWTMIEVANQSYGRPDKIVWYEKPLWKTTRQWWAGQGWLAKENNIKEYLKQWGIKAPIEYAWHHHAHAAYGYYTSGFDNATILCMDSIGEWECLTIWKGEGDKLTKVYSQRYPHSVGLFYSAMTQRCGLVPNKDEYKIAGMAKEGTDSYVGLVKKELINNEVKYFVKSTKEDKIVPNFLIDNNQDFLNDEILINGLRLVGDYLEKSILKPNNINYPLNRLRFLNTFK